MRSLLESKTINLAIKNCDDEDILSVLQKYEGLSDIFKYNNYIIRWISRKLINNEIYYNDLKILKFLDIYFPRVLIDNIIYKYI